MPSSSFVTYEIENRENLFQVAMKGKWGEVEKIYERDPRSHRVPITRTGGTALHLAVAEGKEESVIKLVNEICKNDIGALKMVNDAGYTPLHHAASVGNTRMCDCLAEADPSLLGIRNKNKETPLFIAALHGKMDAFLCLHSVIIRSSSSSDHDYTRRLTDGNTVLHVAIAGEYFDFAFQIIHLYKNLCDSMNEQGLTPLHVLATKSSAFASGTYLRLCKRLLYQCILVEDLKINPDPYKSNPQSEERKNVAQSDLLFSLANNSELRDIFIDEEEEISRTDIENPTGKCHIGYLSATSPSIEYCRTFLQALMWVIRVVGTKIIKVLRPELVELRQRHKWSIQIMNELFRHSKPIYQYLDAGVNREQSAYPQGSEGIMEEVKKGNDQNLKNETEGKKGDDQKVKNETEGKKVNDQKVKNETVILIAAKNGVMEIVDRVLEDFPVAVHDRNSEKKNILILAAENRQANVINLLVKKKMLRESIIRKVDLNQNSVLHVAAQYKEDKPWPIPGSALQMQWEIKWFQFVKDFIPNVSLRRNKKDETAEEVFSKTHGVLIKEGREWLIKTSESSSVVAALIAGVSFATSASIPGGTMDNSGKPIFEARPAFKIFSMASVVALCFSCTALVMFLSIITSRFEEKDFNKNLPGKLLLGLTSLFVSIGSMLLCFCAGHFLMADDRLKYAALPVYALTCLPASIFAAAQFPLYFDLVWTTFKNPFHYFHQYK